MESTGEKLSNLVGQSCCSALISGRRGSASPTNQGGRARIGFKASGLPTSQPPRFWLQAFCNGFSAFCNGVKRMITTKGTHHD